jgi:Putative prokaryotic signal transducing protein
MIELTRSNDPVLLSFVESLMTEAGIPVVIADANISIMEGSIGAFPRRVLIDPERIEGARELLAEAELDIATPPR